MDSQRCHHCGSIGHKKFDCTERCRVGCKWCDTPPTRRPPAVSKINLDNQRQNGLNSQRNLGTLSGGSGGQANSVQIGQSVPQIGPAGIPLGPANVQLGTSGLSHGQNALQMNGTNVPLGRPQNVGPLLPSIINPSMRPLAPQPLGSGWPLIQQQAQQPSLFAPHQVSHQVSPQQTFFFQPTTNVNFVQNTQSVSQFPQSQVQLLNPDNSSIQSVPTVSLPQQFSQQFVPNNWNNLNNLSIQQSRVVPFNGMQMDQQVTRLPGQQTSDLNKLLAPKFNQHQFPTSTPDNTNQSSSTILSTSQLQTSSAQPSCLDSKFPHDISRTEKQSNKDSADRESRDLGDTSTEINNKLQRLKNQIELGIHSKVRPPKWVSTSIDQLPFNNLVQDNKQSSDLSNGKDLTKNLNGDRNILIAKDNSQLDHFVEVKMEETGIMQNLKSPMLNDVSMPSNIIPAETSPDNLFRARRDKSPNRPLKDISIRERANSHPLTSSIGNESQRFERDRSIATFQRNKSRSLSPVRDAREYVRDYREYTRSTSPGKYCVRSVSSYDDRYHSRHPGHDYRDKYYIRPSGTEYSEKYPRSMSLAPYEEYYSRYSSDKPEDRGHSYRDYEREQILVRPRSRSPSVYHQRAPYDDYSRRINNTNGWYGDDPYNRDYQVRSGAYYDLVRDERYEHRDRAYSARPEGERGYGEREYARPMDYEYPSRRRPVDRW
ncbi:10759_t:CDS:2 [Dentiscutata erythropus]|uniref:10759_t:CDS:1 n=1 Tax=Dentiscutata erythropus TaxID=1348616 RepID=A0A9N9EM04_9GLOM|nr:10759_t:CDS:2 [Dentiscutata erythropus]